MGNVLAEDAQCRTLRQPNHTLKQLNKSVQFPIADVLPQLAAQLARDVRLVLEAPPGAGKTTQVPLALLEAAWLMGRKILLLEPRRIAARAAAEFMAAQLGEAVGETVGYRIRFESKISARTRIEVITEGILTRLIQSNPELPEVGAILFDEFHERHLHGDLGAALALDVQASLRPDLRLIIMSATLDGERIARWFDAPRLSSAGRSFPVRIEFPATSTQEPWPIYLRRVVAQAMAANGGDILVFLPGRREIERAKQTLSSDGSRGIGLGKGAALRITESVQQSLTHPPHPNPLLQAGLGEEAVQLVPLHGELSLTEQHAALAPAPSGMRRIVLATNVAESSVTLPGITIVIDLGQAREPRFDPNSGFTRLQTVAISQASADQRSGRAGRVAAGLAYRLWPQSLRLESARRAEIGQVELSHLALELAAWGTDNLRWLDPPPPGALASARELLQTLGALDGEFRLTALGRSVLHTGASPRLAAAALRAAIPQRALACDLIALIEARNPLRGEPARSDDFRQRHAALMAYRDRKQTRVIGADFAALRAIDQASAKWRQRLAAVSSTEMDSSSGAAIESSSATQIGDCLIHAFPDRIARQDANDPRRYRLSNGRGAQLHQNSHLFGEPWLLVIDARFDSADSLVLSAVPFDAGVLERDFDQAFVCERSTRWNRQTRAIESFEQRRFARLVLQRRAVAANPDEALTALLSGVRELGIDVLAWSHHAISLRTRAAFLRECCPELALPNLDDAALLATLEDWLAPFLVGKTRLDALTPSMLTQALATLLDYSQRRQIEEFAPESIIVPSGQSRRLQYTSATSPVLAVKLQELFGLADTPRIAMDRVPVTLHLLSPAQRPIQVTQDLRGFWDRTYPQIKRELKGRYPRHVWPDDPWSATPTHRAKPRS